MGVPGMILAPVVLNYIRIEASDIEVRVDGPHDSSSPNS